MFVGLLRLTLLVTLIIDGHARHAVGEVVEALVRWCCNATLRTHRIDILVKELN